MSNIYYKLALTNELWIRMVFNFSILVVSFIYRIVSITRLDWQFMVLTNHNIQPSLMAFMYLGALFSETQNTYSTNNYILLQFHFPKETNTRGSKAPTPFTPFHTNLQSFD